MRYEANYAAAEEWLKKLLSDGVARGAAEIHAIARETNQPFGPATINGVIWYLRSSGCVEITKDHTVRQGQCGTDQPLA